MEQPKEGYMQLSQKVVEYANGLPLALVTLGSFLVGRTTDEWQSALDSFKKTKGEILDILKISYDGLEEMWKEIFLDIACGNLGKQSRLWLIEDLLCVLENNMASKAIRAIVVKCDEKDFKFGEFSEAFSNMPNLRLLSVSHRRNPNAFNSCSLKCLPSSFQLKELGHLDLWYNNLEYLWEGVKFLGKLKYVHVDCSNLIRTPDFSGIPSLEKLILFGCSRLVEIHPSIGQLSRLSHLQLQLCKSLTDLPSMSAEMESLTVLNLNSCSNLSKIPEFKGIMKSLSELHLSWTAINCQSFQQV
nr:TMV resistance protein N-like [Quercus suber]